MLAVIVSDSGVQFPMRIEGAVVVEGLSADFTKVWSSVFVDAKVTSEKRFGDE